ncbi:MAG TPA: DNA-directed RNA polymerase subunit beta [bacterium]|nr:DNA-directed RNA polymerase subunit beta [bacterium]
MSQHKPFRNRAGRVSFATHQYNVDFPNFIEAQLRSFDWFKEKGLEELFAMINPIKDTMEKMWTLEFKEFRWGDPNRTEKEAIEKGLSYDAPVFIKSQLLNNKTGEIKEQEVFVADIPIMSDQAYFVINGVKRVVVHQIVRAEGVLFAHDYNSNNRDFYKAILMPGRGTWYTFEVSKRDVVSVKLAKKRSKVLITELLRVLGYETDAEIKELFSDVDTNSEHKYIDATLARDFTQNKEEAIISIYNKLRPDETVTLTSAEKYIKSIFFNEKKFKLGLVGRYQLNRKLGTDYPVDEENSKLYLDDVIKILKRLIQVNNGEIPGDDIDHLGNRRIRSVGEVLEDQLGSAMKRIEKNIRDKMSMYGEDAKLTPSMLIGTRPLSASILSFFGQNQLSVFMEQTNILSELENKRKVTGAGPGGILKERAPFSLREVHSSHYSRFDPVTSPESNAIGVVTQLATFAKVNQYGFIEAPYRKVYQTAKNAVTTLRNRMPIEDVKDSKGKVIAKAGKLINADTAKLIAAQKDIKKVEVYSYITDEVEYLDPDTEDRSVISVSTVEQDEHGNIIEKLVPVKDRGEFMLRDSQTVNYVDIIPSQQAGLGFALIPFGANDDSRRTLMGSNQSRQGVPLLKQESPITGTGYEDIVAKQTGWGVFAEEDGTVKYVDADKVIVNYKKKGIIEYSLTKFERSNHDNSFSQYPRVEPGDKFKEGDLLVDGPTMDNGEVAIGTNIRVALMFYEGANYEDSAVISERLVKNDALTSVHIKEYSAEVRDTELGPEVLTADIPHVSDRILNKLDSNGVVRIGSRVVPGDILTGVVAPRGEKELTAEERLLRAIFGDASSDVRDNSLRLPNGDKGIVIATNVLSVEDGEKLPPGVLKKIKVWVAQTKKIDYGDKLSGRHGDKSTIAAIKPIEDMPYTADGEPVDMILTPIFMKRMNMGQALEVHFGKWGSLLGCKFAIPPFEKISLDWLESELKKNGYDMREKEELYDGRTGEKFPRPITVGVKYMLKLKHIADEKVHARSTGPYTLVTQQPLGGKAQMGGQRFGEMEVWALEAHGAANALQEMLTIKSDDVTGRAAAYKAIIQGDKIENVNVPESFKVLVKELNALSLNIELISKKSKGEVKYEE